MGKTVKAICEDSFHHEEIAMMDKRKAYEEMLDAQFEELSAQIGLFRARALLMGRGKIASADRARVEVKLPSTARP